jgi:hypothetical protein
VDIPITVINISPANGEANSDLWNIYSQFYVPLENISLMETSPLPVKGGKM